MKDRWGAIREKDIQIRRHAPGVSKLRHDVHRSRFVDNSCEFRNCERAQLNRANGFPFPYSGAIEYFAAIGGRNFPIFLFFSLSFILRSVAIGVTRFICISIDGICKRLVYRKTPLTSWTAFCLLTLLSFWSGRCFHWEVIMKQPRLLWP